MALLFVAAVLIDTTANAHEVIGADGQPTHGHVYKRAPNGNGVIAGHAARPAGSNGIVLWQSAPVQNYGQPQSGMRIPHDPWSKKNRKAHQQRPHKPKPAFTKRQSRTPVFKPQ